MSRAALVKVEYDVGRTLSGARLRLTRLSSSRDAGHEWVLTREAGGQTDSEDEVRGLTEESIMAMAEAVTHSRVTRA